MQTITVKRNKRFFRIASVVFGLIVVGEVFVLIRDGYNGENVAGLCFFGLFLLIAVVFLLNNRPYLNITALGFAFGNRPDFLIRWEDVEDLEFRTLGRSTQVLLIRSTTGPRYISFRMIPWTPETLFMIFDSLRRGNLAEREKFIALYLAQRNDNSNV